MGLLSCAEDDSQLLPSKEQGTIVFELAQTTPFGVTSLQEISTVKVTLESAEGLIELPSLKFHGNEDYIATHPHIIDRGSYRIVGYKAFGSDANLLLHVQELPFAVEFVIEPGDAKSQPLPVGLKEVPTGSNLRNTLYTLCKEVFGENRDLWPATWQDSTDLVNFKGVEFVMNDYDEPSHIQGIILGSDFAPMKRLPDVLHNLVTLQTLTIRDNALEQLPINFARTSLEMLSIINTNLSTLPSNFANLETLAALQLEGNKFTELPAVIFNLPNLNLLEVRSEPIVTLPTELGKLEKLVLLTLSDLKVTALPDAFERFVWLTELNISGNRNLSTLPQSLGTISYGGTSHRLRTLNASSCAFAAIPDLLYSPKFADLNLADNQITAVDPIKAANWTLLTMLNLNRNPLTAFPTLYLPNLYMLGLVDCGLIRSQVDISQMPQLSPNHLFLTQSEWEQVFE